LGSVAGACGLIDPKGAGVLDPSVGAAPKLNLGAAGISALVSKLDDPDSDLDLSPFSGVDKGLAAPKLKVALAVSSDFFLLGVDPKENPGTSLGFSSFVAEVVDELVVNVKPPPPLLVAGACAELGACAGDEPPNVKPPPVVLALAAGAAPPNVKPPPLLAAGAGAALKINPPVETEEESFDLLSGVVLVEAPPKLKPEEETTPAVADLSPAGAEEEEYPAPPVRSVSQEAQTVLSSSV
jgi:hypothetical protein